MRQSTKKLERSWIGAQHDVSCAAAALDRAQVALSAAMAVEIRIRQDYEIALATDGTSREDRQRFQDNFRAILSGLPDA